MQTIDCQEPLLSGNLAHPRAAGMGAQQGLAPLARSRVPCYLLGALSPRERASRKTQLSTDPVQLPGALSLWGAVARPQPDCLASFPAPVGAFRGRTANHACPKLPVPKPHNGEGGR